MTAGGSLYGARLRRGAGGSLGGIDGLVYPVDDRTSACIARCVDACVRAGVRDNPDVSSEFLREECLPTCQVRCGFLPTPPPCPEGQSRCGVFCCPDDPKWECCYSKGCCRRGEEACVPGYGCCRTDRVTVDGCCAEGREIWTDPGGARHCCDPGQVPTTDGCCDAWRRTPEGGCCPSPRVLCDDRCCAPGERCVQGRCCPPGKNCVVPLVPKPPDGGGGGGVPEILGCSFIGTSCWVGFLRCHYCCSDGSTTSVGCGGPSGNGVLGCIGFWGPPDCPDPGGRRSKGPEPFPPPPPPAPWPF
jgi:hypothetical protein